MIHKFKKDDLVLFNWRIGKSPVIGTIRYLFVGENPPLYKVVAIDAKHPGDYYQVSEDLIITDLNTATKNQIEALTNIFK